MPDIDAPEGDEDLTIPAAEGEAADEAPEDELEITFGDEPAPDAPAGQDSSLVRKLRAEVRERDARLSALTRGETVKPVEVGEKPTLEACEYDAGKFEADLDAWKARKAQADEAEAAARKSKEASNAAWSEELAALARKKAALRAPDYDAAESEVVASFTPIQQAVLVKASEDGAKVIYALGKHPAKLAVAISKLEGTLKVTTKRSPIPPEGTARGSAPLSRGVDKTLERLEADADKTGNRTKVIQYKRELRQKSVGRR